MEDVRPLSVEELRAKRLAALEKLKNPSTVVTNTSNTKSEESNEIVNRVDGGGKNNNNNSSNSNSNSNSNSSSNTNNSWWNRLKDTIWGEELD